MVTVCAWCQRYMGSKEPLQDPAVSHGICSACVERQSLTDTPVVVVSPARVSTIPLLQTLLRGAPDVTIVVDRRYGERRDGRSNGNGNGNGHGNGDGHVLSGPFDRRTDDRRHLTALYLV
ncbi:MAG: hypothetical protein LJF15_17625 [Acidobacteria bacterium]|nr:hypothetical protein [Acidobacteriota bacterium]